MQDETLHILGRKELLVLPKLGLICSIQCPGSVVLKTFDAIRELRDAGVVVAGGFHSPMERECLGFLLKGKQPIVICLAKGLGKVRLPALWRSGIDAGRMLLVSPFADSIRRTTQAQAQTRNQILSRQCQALLIPHASPGGHTEVLAYEILSQKTPVFTLPVEENQQLLSRGAKPCELNEVQRVIGFSRILDPKIRVVG